MNEATSAAWPPWERVTIDASWTNEGTESVGSDGAAWIRDPEGRHWLHKSSRVHSTHVDGEDWAEVATTTVGKFLGIPCASTRLCRSGKLNGSLSLRIHDPRTHTFVEGGLRLLDVPRVR